MRGVQQRISEILLPEMRSENMSSGMFEYSQKGIELHWYPG